MDFREPPVETLEAESELSVGSDISETKIIVGDEEPDVPRTYEKLLCLGQGGMGWVFKVRNKETNAIFSMKILRPELLADPTAVARFELEIKAASALNHGNLVSIYEYGRTESGAPFILMDFVDGKSLSEIIEHEGSLDHKRAIAIFTQIGEAIAHAHGNGIVHRDLKPSNILVSQRENTDIVRVVDFGIARLMHSADDATQQMTQTGEIFGSPLYMSPEQCRGDDVDRRADIYALGCLMYEVLTGKPPFQGINPVQTILKQLNEQAPRFARRLEKRDVPVGLEQIVLHCLQKDAAERYQFMEEVIKDLELVDSGKAPVVAVRQSAGQKRSFIQRIQKPMVALYVLLMIGYMGWLSQFDTLNQIGLLYQTSGFLALFLLVLYGILYLADEAMAVGGRVLQKATLPGDHWLLASLLLAGVGPIVLDIDVGKQLVQTNLFDGTRYPSLLESTSPLYVMLVILIVAMTAVTFFMYLKRKSETHLRSVLDTQRDQQPRQTNQ